MTLDDLELPKRHSGRNKIKYFYGPIINISTKINQFYQRQKCRPMILVSRNIRCMRTFAGVPRGGEVKHQWCRVQRTQAMHEHCYLLSVPQYQANSHAV